MIKSLGGFPGHERKGGGYVPLLVRGRKIE